MTAQYNVGSVILGSEAGLKIIYVGYYWDNWDNLKIDCKLDNNNGFVLDLLSVIIELL